MPAAPPAELKKFLKAYDKPVRDLFLATRGLVMRLAPDASETVWDAYNAVATGFSFTPKWNQGFIHIAAYATHVNLGFNHGAALKDPRKLLHGSGSKIRHIRIATPTDLDRAHIKAFIRAAVAHIAKIGFGPARAKAKPTTVIRVMAGPRRRPDKKRGR